MHASDLLIAEGAMIDGSVIAQNVTICGHVKGSIRAVRVKLQNGGAVEGDIYHRSLSIIVDDPDLGAYFIKEWNLLKDAGNGYPPTLMQANSSSQSFAIDGGTIVQRQIRLLRVRLKTVEGRGHWR